MVRVLPVAVELAILVFCLVDCIQADPARIRNLPKGVWILLIIVLPLIGGVAWLVAGRPVLARTGRPVPWPSTATAGFPEYERPRTLAPDDDPEFLAGLRASDDRHETMLRDWEADLRDRERRLRQADGNPPVAGAADEPDTPPRAGA